MTTTKQYQLQLRCFPQASCLGKSTLLDAALGEVASVPLCIVPLRLVPPCVEEEEALGRGNAG